MSAEMAVLGVRLERAVLQGAVSLQEAWDLQDLILSADSPGQYLEVPESMEPTLARLWLLEERPANLLPL
jgi:hypothetical protein